MSEQSGNGLRQRGLAWLWLRRFSQVISLCFFLYLFLRYRYQDQNLLQGPLHLFFRLDPLLWLSEIVASWRWTWFFLPALAVLLLTVLLGRFFCAWICPLGALFDGIGTALNARRGRQPGNLSPSYRLIKYLLLLVLIVLAIFGFNWIGIFDPLALFFRSLALAIYPAASYSGERLFDLLFGLSPEKWGDSLDAIYSVLKGPLLAERALSYHLLVFTGLLFIGVLLLELVERRFWCKNLCPLGALFGLFARWRRLRRLPAKLCGDCGECKFLCKMDSFATESGRQNLRECILCMSCQVSCRENRVQYRFKASQPAVPHPDIGRRRIVLAVVSAAVSLPLLKVGSKRAQAQAIRPAGALPESEFLQRCLRCGACMKVCVTNGLQPLLLQGGLDALWTPSLVPRQGYCEFHCTLCGQACPTGAIRALSVAEKQRTVIGKAVTDPSRCIPYARGQNCLVCEEHCPTSPKAIVLRPQKKMNPHGKVVTVKLPVVILDRCIGCGICENKCPVEGLQAGIRVRPLVSMEQRLLEKAQGAGRKA
ncbi:MAG: 4Fe-4S binding protein [Deltaproteobacteria bacterium]|nr:4Fe-4S binding protein [Deltaproteobacteria bacterium]MBW2071013.1 4Fe-4S binding protein [Deltaproteobacteria bacterium]